MCVNCVSRFMFHVSKRKIKMEKVSINKSIRLSQHYTLGEMTRTGTGIQRKKGGRYWLHFAVRPEDNRRKTGLINA